MKQRMLNTFTRKLKIPILAKLCTELGYLLFQIYYFFASIFLKIKSNEIEINEKEVNVARKILAEKRPKPNMYCEMKNDEISDSIDLSIVIPAYNVERYIEDCLNSVLNQKTDYVYEVIVVNDGATDNTDAVIKKFADNRINYIVQKNQGLSGARNAGTNVARGKYITFVDSDDVMEENSIQNMMKAIIDHNADIVVGGYYTFCDGLSVKQNFVSEPLIIENDNRRAVENPGYAWGKIYKRSLFEKIRFPMDAWYEDTLVCSVLYRMCKKMVVIDDIVYGYRINPNGISQTARSSEKSLDHYWVMEDALEKAKMVGLENDDVQYNIVFNHMSTFLYRRISLLPDEVIRSAFIMACNMLNEIRPAGYKMQGNKIRKDLEKAFETGNYKLWKLTSFLI